MKTKRITEISVDDLFEMFSNKGKFASVTFVKKDGTLRKLTGKAFVDKDIKGTGAYDAKSHGQIRLFDINVKDKNGERIGGWRTVTANKVKEVVSNGVKYVIT